MDTRSTRIADAERVLDEVIDLPSDARVGRARELCGADPDLWRLVERILGTGEAPMARLAGASLLREAIEGHADATGPSAVGPFRVLSELGRGGMGRVFLARRGGSDSAPLVALKVLHRFVDLPEARRRFEHERETLAMLSHPHVAHLHDGGITDDGTPYLAMEFVDGFAIDRHCDERALGLDARLALFRQVCLAVEYAHGRLVVHRDLKPGNVLVDGHGQAKLLDFGIAKWLDELDPVAGDADGAPRAHTRLRGTRAVRGRRHHGGHRRLPTGPVALRADHGTARGRCRRYDSRDVAA